MEYDKVIALMPARFAARRFPGKLIADIGDRSVLKRTYDQVVMCDDIDELYVVTADDIIKDHCKTYDIPFLLSLIHISEPRDQRGARMPSSA